MGQPIGPTLKGQTVQEDKIKVQAYVGKVTTSVFWESVENLLEEFLKRGATIRSEQYVQTLMKLTKGIRRVRLNRNKNQVLILPTVTI